MGLINSKKHSVEAKYSTLNGVYPTCEWDPKSIRKLVVDKKVSPLFPGKEDPGENTDECPICLLYYTGGLNKAKCCRQEICTECLLQIKRPGLSLDDITCPFCNISRFATTFSGPKSAGERQRERRETEKVERLEAQMREAEKSRDRKRKEERRKEEKKRKAKEKMERFDDAKPPVVVTPVDESAETIASLSAPGDGSPKKDLEEIMLMEAIRLSLMDSDPPDHVIVDDNVEGSSTAALSLDVAGVESDGNSWSE